MHEKYKYNSDLYCSLINLSIITNSLMQQGCDINFISFAGNINFNAEIYVNIAALSITISKDLRATGKI